MGRLAVIAGIAIALCGVLYLCAADLMGLFDDPETETLYAMGDDGEMIELDLDAPGLVSKGTGLSPEEEDALARKRAEEAAKPQFDKSEGLTGTVRDGAGNPIPKAQVMLVRAPLRQRSWTPLPPPLASTLTDEKGEFLVGPAPEDEPLILRAEAGGFAPSNEWVARRGTRIDLVLDRGGGLTVRVLDEDSKPVTGAKVMHSIGWGWNAILSTGTTPDDGTVAFLAVPTGSGSLVVTAGGHAAVRQGNVAVTPGKVEEKTIVLEGAKQVEGTVLDAETEMPIEGATVEVHYPRLAVLEPTKGGKTDAEGKFQVLADVSTGEQIQLRVRAPEYAEQRLTRNITDQAADEITIKLTEGYEGVSGYVYGPDRHAVAGATVTYSGFQGEEDLPTVETKEDGSFDLPALPWAQNGVTLIAISREHGAATQRTTLPKKDGPPTPPVEITLPGAGMIEGTVTGREGNPVEGALVSIAVDYQESRSRLGNQTNPWQISNMLNDKRRFNLTAITDDAGRFLIEGVPALSYRVLARFGLDQARTEEPVTVEGGSAVQAEITLKAGGTIEGYVLDSEEQPVAGAYIYAQPQDQRARGWGLPQPHGRAQSDGHFVLQGVEDYDYTIHASAGGYGGKNEKNVRQGETDLTIRVVRLGWIKGVVESVDGTPYKGTFIIHSTKQQPEGQRNRWWGGNSTQTFNTDDGTFEVRGLQEGRYDVRASTRSGDIGMQKEVVHVTNGRGSREVHMRLTQGAVLTGRVLKEEDDSPLKNAYVYLSVRSDGGQDTSGATTGNGRSDAKGRYEIKGLGSGAYNVHIWHNGLNWSVPVDIQLGEVKELDLLRREPGMIEILVLDSGGNAIAGAYPTVKSESGQQIQPNWQLLRRDGLMGRGRNAWNEATRTNAEGLNVRYHVPPGRYQVSASAQGFRPDGAGPWVEVAGGATTSITVKLKKPQ